MTHPAWEPTPMITISGEARWTLTGPHTSITIKEDTKLWRDSEHM